MFKEPCQRFNESFITLYNLNSEFTLNVCVFLVQLGKNTALTGLLSERGGLALAILRQSGNADVVVDARFQSVDRVLTGCGQHLVFKDRHALAGCNYSDPVTSDGFGVERCPA